MSHNLKNRLLISAIAVLIVVFVSCYIGVITPYWKITPDSTTYVEGGKSIASGKGYTQLGEPARLFPPMTSLIFCPFLLVFPKNYLVLNAVTTFFVFSSLLVFFLLFSKTIGYLKSSLIILLSLGSVFLYKQSTFLLSDVFYMFFSVSVLVVVGNRIGENESSQKYLLAGVLALGACMTRTLGLTLVVAILLNVSLSFFQKKSKLKPVLLLSMLLPLLFIFLWGMRNARLGLSYFDLFFQKEIYVPESGYISLFGLIERFFVNLKKFVQIGAVLINEASHAFFVRAFCIKAASMGVFFLGLFASLKREVNVQNVYIILYLMAIEINPGEISYRLFIPILPLIFYYGLLGIEFIIKKGRDFLGQFAPNIIYAVGIFYVLIYLGFGFAAMLKILPEEHRSPFGSHVIKYEANYDVQKLALWFRDHSMEDDTYICQHPNIWDIVTERKGYHFPFSRDQSRLLDLIEKKKINYILVDKKKLEVNNFLIPVIEAHPAKFVLIADEENASLYKVGQQDVS